MGLQLSACIKCKDDSTKLGSLPISYFYYSHEGEVSIIESEDLIEMEVRDTSTFESPKCKIVLINVEAYLEHITASPAHNRRPIRYVSGTLCEIGMII